MGFDDNLTIKLHPNDNVAIAFKDIEKEETTQKIKANTRIPQGHKIALKKIKKGEEIIKYDQTIGLAGKDILAGDHVHTENTQFLFSKHNYEFSTSVKIPNFVPSKLRPSFNGYKRKNGQVGTRNYIGVLTSVNCSATAAKNISNFFEAPAPMEDKLNPTHPSHHKARLSYFYEMLFEPMRQVFYDLIFYYP